MIKTVVICDECGTEKQQTNHWFVIWTDPDGFHSARFTPETRSDPTIKHVCGAQHGSKMFMRWMATGKLEPEKGTPRNTDNSLKLVPQAMVHGEEEDAQTS